MLEYTQGFFKKLFMRVIQENCRDECGNNDERGTLHRLDLSEDMCLVRMRAGATSLIGNRNVCRLTVKGTFIGPSQVQKEQMMVST